MQQAVRPNYMQGYEITERMRALLIDWLVQVHSRFQLLQETLYLTVAVLDRFLQVRIVFCVVLTTSSCLTTFSCCPAGPAGVSQETSAGWGDGHVGGL